MLNDLYNYEYRRAMILRHNPTLDKLPRTTQLVLAGIAALGTASFAGTRDNPVLRQVSEPSWQRAVKRLKALGLIVQDGHQFSLKPVSKPCVAQQQGDEMFCHQCGTRWEVTDPHPPICKNKEGSK